MTTPVITIDMGRPCARCGKGGAADNGLCLRCITKQLKETKMPPKQEPLIPMSDDEMRKAAQKLAGLVRELAVMRADHAEIRKEQKLEQEKLEQKITDIATTIREQGKA